MTPFDAWLFAASWGSYMTSGDPGACMYGFDETCRVQDETHREACLHWIDTECLPLVRNNKLEYDEDEEDKLLALRAYLMKAPLA
jgi:hypothetical protein